jgi:hypothetical protein
MTTYKMTTRERKIPQVMETYTMIIRGRKILQVMKTYKMAIRERKIPQVMKNIQEDNQGQENTTADEKHTRRQSGRGTYPRC